ncbi:type II toxin-antitoxin system Phd/YefM family antitoxin [Nocardia sp. NPDC004278]
MTFSEPEEVVITRAGRESAVVISLREYESLTETAYLLGSPADARHLERSIEQLRSVDVEHHELDETDDGDDE